MGGWAVQGLKLSVVVARAGAVAVAGVVVVVVAAAGVVVVLLLLVGRLAVRVLVLLYSVGGV